MDNTNHSKYKKFVILTLLSITVGAILSLAKISENAPENSIFNLLLIFSFVGIQKAYPYSGWKLNLWSIICVSFACYAIVGFHDRCITNNLKTSVFEALENKEVQFSTQKHGIYADFFRCIMEKRSELELLNEEFSEQLMALGWEVYGINFILKIEYWKNPDLWEASRDALLKINESIKKYEIKWMNDYNVATNEIRSLFYRSFKSSDVNELWNKCHEKMVWKGDAIIRQIQILSDITILNLDLINLVESCNGEYYVEDKKIVFLNNENLEKYHQIFKKIISLLAENEGISEAIEEMEKAYIEELKYL